ncbi:hypothetical protein O181_004589 [Austropuccinia psidii MF-1]|uniref:Peptidase A1 domain-containing protein n=1 Tax=Austropuccinia psidii MF-1 TaxID=1389203 RepID=A0A9Q3GF11_9BASI|nr:hypothetical protein [Austropuccinia psidii MF-1]
MKLLLYLLGGLSVTLAHIVIPLGSKAPLRVASRSTLGGTPQNSERVVDWSELKYAAQRTIARYSVLGVKTPPPSEPRFRWLASDSLPGSLRQLAMASDYSNEHPMKNDNGENQPSSGSGSRRTALRTNNMESDNDQNGDLDKGDAFAKLGWERGSRYLKQRIGTTRNETKKLHRVVSQEKKLLPHKNTFTRWRPKQETTFKSHSEMLNKSKQRTRLTTEPTEENGHTLLIDSVSDKGDIEFYGQIQVGTPPKTFMIDFDTGSSDMWVKSSSCKENCGRRSKNPHQFYEPNNSTTSKDLKTQFHIAYGVGGVSGRLYEDTVSVSGYQVLKQDFASCDILSEDWSDDPADGVLGLAFESIATSGKKPWFYNALDQNSALNQSFNSQMFSFALGRLSSGSHSQSELYLGGKNPKKYIGDFQWVPLMSNTYWRIQLRNLSCNNGVDENSKVNIPLSAAIIDSGTTYIAAPNDQARMFWGSVPNARLQPGEGFYTYPCAQTVKMTFEFEGGVKLVVNELDMNLGKVSPGSDRCVGAVFGGQTGGNWILGISFMKSYYTTFDLAGSRIGFATPSYH